MDSRVAADNAWLLPRPWRCFAIAAGSLTTYLTIVKLLFLALTSYKAQLDCAGLYSLVSDAERQRRTWSYLGWGLVAIIGNGSYFLLLATARRKSRLAVHLSWLFGAIAMASAAYWYAADSCDRLAYMEAGTKNEWTVFWSRGLAYKLVSGIGFMAQREGSLQLALAYEVYALHAYAGLFVPWFGVLLGQIGVIRASRRIRQLPAEVFRAGDSG